MERINPCVDIAFKKLFGIEENKDLLISLINATVSQEDQVVDVKLLNPYNQKQFSDDKLSILDIKAQGACGKMFNIEIQITDDRDYDKRALYYWAKLYAEQLMATQEYSKLEKVIGIHILNFTSIPKSQKYHNVFHITEKEDGFPYFDSLELHTIELNKFASAMEGDLAASVSQIQDSLSMWSTFLTNYEALENLNNLPEGLDKPALKKALGVLDVMNFTKKERGIYEDHLKWLRTEANTLLKAEEKAEERGIKKGRKEGRKEGMAIGEKKRSQEIARQMLAQDMDSALICQLTGLTKEEMDQLR